jgi:hypothetical protein
MHAYTKEGWERIEAATPDGWTGLWIDLNWRFEYYGQVTPFCEWTVGLAAAAEDGPGARITAYRIEDAVRALTTLPTLTILSARIEIVFEKRHDDALSAKLR